jgi:type IV pilus assembly protein PilO
MSLQLRREQVLLGAPVLLGVLLAAALGGLVVWPRWQRLQADQQELLVLEEQQQRLPLLRRQLESLEQQREQADRRNAQILGLIAGSGELQTFLAQLSEQAAQTGVLLDGYEPVQAVAPPTSKKNNKTAAETPPADPLLAPGLKKTSVLLRARGSGPQLLDFLRRLERLSLLVVQSDLSLKSGNSSKDKDGRVVVEPTELRLNLGLYARDHSPSQKPGKPG